MVSITGYAVDVVHSSTHISSTGYIYLNGATVYLGSDSGLVSSNGFFTVTLSDPTVSTTVVKYPRYEITEVAITSSTIINVWQNKAYT